MTGSCDWRCDRLCWLFCSVFCVNKNSIGENKAMGLRDRIRKGDKRNVHSTVGGSNPSNRLASTGSFSAPSTPVSSIFLDASVPSPQTKLKEPQDELKLGRFINIAVTGQRQVGKSSLINAIVGKHVANLHAQRIGEGNIYKHPVLSDIIFHEISRSDGIRKDFRLFALVIICFETSVTEADLEVAKRATERKVPVIFVCPKADLTTKRLMNFANLNEREGIRETRKSINSKPDMQWFQRKEIDRKFYVVSCPDLFERNPHPNFDEEEFLYHVMSFLQPARGYGTASSPDEHTGLAQYHRNSDRTPPSAASTRDSGGRFQKSAEILAGHRHHRTPTPIKSPPIRSGERVRPNRDHRGAATPEFHSSEAPTSPPTNLTASVTRSTPSHASVPRTPPSSSVAPSPGSAASLGDEHSRGDTPSWPCDVRVAFIEETENVNRGTLMECLLGGTRGNKLTIASNVAYRHPDYPNASFQLIKSESIPPNSVHRYFETTLSNMTLIVIVFTKQIRENDVKLILQARRFGIKFIFAHSKSAENATDKTFSPRAAFRKLKVTNHDARQTLLKAGLRSEEILIFEVDKKILRYPESYPRADEEEFKEFIADACGGRRSQHRGSSASKRGAASLRAPSEPTRGHAPSASIFGSTKRTDSFHLSNRGSPPSRSSGFVVRDQSSMAASPAPALKNPNSSPSVGSGTPKGSATVTWQTPQEIRVAVVGQHQSGKSTLINGTLQLNVAQVGEGRRGDAPTVHRHPAHYDLIFEECAGYEPKMSQNQLERWIQQQNLKSMDYVLIVINGKLCSVDIQIARYCEKRNIVVAVIATKVDIMVSKGVYDEQLTEVAAMSKARYKILENFKACLQEEYLNAVRIFIVSGRALCPIRDSDRETSEAKYQFDELDYLRFVTGTIASPLA
eukprot:Gregarina_sp_Poly_1__9826@NODE_62_length_16615_cov_49_436669_g53_i0_p2_GENE_NODE_62_length_16615_cov_49_436669_g53_i0NODE_62_length_16615_cov_49_436669_g53_i0_p2_ORF_typecomplete_len907_score103_74IIGP/PF05049_13/1_9e15IIGP/PF05049_13/5_6e09IIGP/PF05049_13/1_9e21MMR_HSR1/PF01926_23/0_00065MMR_HSR1/PF01926_23/2_4e05Dynamin_N/PF00350_23/0_0029Dynamin_N/PF00350_23/0_0001FeoB_N/PF02421_18/0_034FeoB_N/PF02421_18/7FeoB_N/PF02421_18/1_1e02FeoB_N/PF02421_18/0_035RsgA_GTPase/PF03193_16/0_0045RsgA_GTPase/